MSVNESISKGVKYFTEAVEEDRNKNYDKALTLYQTGLEYFSYVVEHEAVSDKVKECIQNKCFDYTERAMKISNYLKNEYVDNLQMGLDIINEAVKEDKNKNYEQAIIFYEKGVDYLLKVGESEILEDNTKEVIREKCLLYLDRTEKIREYLRKLKDEKENKFKHGTSDIDYDPDTRVKSWFCPCFRLRKGKHNK